MNEDTELVEVEAPSESEKKRETTDTPSNQEKERENAENNDQPSTASASNGKEQVATQGNSQPETQRNWDAEIGKMATLEKERNEFAEKAKGWDAAEQVLAADPDAYEAFRRGYKAKYGQDIGSYAERYGEQGTQGNTNTNNRTSQPSMDPISVRRIMQDELDSRAGLEHLIQIAPELHPNNVGQDPVKKQEAMAKFESIGKDALALKQAHPEMSWSQVYERAYYSQPDVWQNASSRNQQIGQMQQQAKANASNVGAEGSIGGSVSVTGVDNKVKMTKGQKERYDYLVSSGRDKIAKAYLENVRNMNLGK